MLSLPRSRHTPEQLVSPALHDTTHALATHTVPDAQVRPQAPQLFVSVVRSRHTPEQLVCPEPQVVTQVPAEQS